MFAQHSARRTKFNLANRVKRGWRGGAERRIAVVTTITLENRALPHRTTATTRCLLLPVLTHPLSPTHPKDRSFLAKTWNFIPRNKLIYEFLLEILSIFYHRFSPFLPFLFGKIVANFGNIPGFSVWKTWTGTTTTTTTWRLKFSNFFASLSIFQSRKQILHPEDRLTRGIT